MKMDAIAIDGPAGAGKSTIARGVAEQLGFLYVDTGAMYRAIAYSAGEQGVDLEDEAAMGKVAAESQLSFDESGTRLFLNGKDISADIRTPEITRITRFAARAQPVREALIRQQQAMARRRPVVMEGRDICTVVLAEAKWKFYVTARAEERARRRQKELEDKGTAVDFNELLGEIEARDASDAEVGPMADALRAARDPEESIVFVDTTEMTADQVIACIAEQVRRKGEEL